STVADATQLWRTQRFDAVLLDLNLPDGSGLIALREARARDAHTPVRVLTARNRTAERIAGLDAGADDYLGKPFDLGEVEARQRPQGIADRSEIGRLLLDRKAGRFFVVSDEGAAAFELPAREFE